MLNMLPGDIFYKNVYYYLSVSKYIKQIDKDYEEFLVSYRVDKYNTPVHEVRYELLRDALFEMLKWLKQNKLI